MNAQKGYLLIVEDDPDIRKLLETTLRFKGYRVVTAQNGREALEIIQRERPALVVADIMMPQLDGFGLVHRMRINPETRGVPVVFITATYVSPEDRDFSRRIGATRFIQKPVEIDVFLSTIEELLERDVHTAIEPLNEIKFYEGYRQRIEAKLDEKIKQITREEHLLRNHSETDGQDLQASLRHARRERDELELLLAQIRKQIEKIQQP
jgi:DNA-binding response OmpR family regulator